MDMTGRPVVFVSRGSLPTGLDRLRETCDVIVWDGHGCIPQVEFVEQVAKYKPHELFIHPPDRVDPELLRAAGEQLKVVGTKSVGLEHVDLEECRRRGVAVGYTPGVLTQATAEHTIGIVIATARRYEEGIRAVHDGIWGTRWDNGQWLVGAEIGGSVIGIVGLGRIGFAVAKRLKGFEPSRILYCGSGPKDNASTIDAEYVTFEDLLGNSDFVIATCSINEKNKGMFNKSAFSKMKKNAIFVNVSRGQLVNQDDLYEVLSNRMIGGAGLDVTSPEPLPPGHRLLGLDNCLVMPHLGSATQVTRSTMCNLTVSNILAGLKGETLPASAL